MKKVLFLSLSFGILGFALGCGGSPTMKTVGATIKADAGAVAPAPPPVNMNPPGGGGPGGGPPK